ncbi:transcription factor HES-5-like isoform X2 [Hyperolius riggenbachi]
MRRDRINSSIEQLRLLLEKEFHKHQLPSKPEKADILEMTVSFLQQHMAGKNVTSAPSPVHRDSYSTGIQDSACYMAQDNMTRHFNTTLTPASPVPGQLSESKSVWRPW